MSRDSHFLGARLSLYVENGPGDPGLSSTVSTSTRSPWPSILPLVLICALAFFFTYLFSHFFFHSATWQARREFRKIIHHRSWSAGVAAAKDYKAVQYHALRDLFRDPCGTSEGSSGRLDRTVMQWGDPSRYEPESGGSANGVHPIFVLNCGKGHLKPQFQAQVAN